MTGGLAELWSREFSMAEGWKDLRAAPGEVPRPLAFQQSAWVVVAVDAARGWVFWRAGTTEEPNALIGAEWTAGRGLTEPKVFSLDWEGFVAAAVDSSGNAFLFTIAGQYPENHVPRVRRYVAGSGWGNPESLDGVGPFLLSIAVDHRGDGWAVWVDRNSVAPPYELRARPIVAGRVTPAVAASIGSTDARLAPTVLLNQQGAVVYWASQPSGANDGEYDLLVRRYVVRRAP
jgi:hypothetical protein